MIELLENNWLWILLGIGVVWFLFRVSGMGYRTGGDSPRSEPSRTGRDDSHAGYAAGTEPTHDHGAGASAAPRRHHGCC